MLDVTDRHEPHAPAERLAPLPQRASRRGGTDAEPELRGSPLEVVQELLERAAVLLSTLKRDVAHLESDLDDEAERIEAERKRRRAAAERALEQLADLKARAGEIAARKGKTLILDLALAAPAPAVEEALTLETVSAELVQEIRAAKGITGAMRLTRIGELLQTATVIVERMVRDADKTKAQLLEEARAELEAESKEAEASFEIGSGILERDLGLLDRALPLTARPWSSTAWSTWTPPSEMAPYVRLGWHAHPRLPAPIPLLRPFPLERTLLLESRRHRADAGRAAVSLALRMVAAVPPGAMQLTLVDPKGLGQSVDVLLALGDDDPALIDGGVASTEEDIEARLADLVRHVERVNAQHLRGRHASLGELTSALGQVVEPFRCLLVFDHPTGLTDQAIRQLETLMETGPRAGVAVVIVRDERPALYTPGGGRVVLPDDIDRLDADEQGFHLEVADAGTWFVALDGPPDAVGGLADRLVGETAAAATQRRQTVVDLPTLATLEAAAGRVRGRNDVQLVDPHQPSSWWRQTSEQTIEVPVGRAGPAAVETLRLDAQARPGAVIAGRPGSGVSNLLNGLVLGAAMRYAPSEIELFLLGFDGARDFAPFAEHRLPHARLVAVDAPRELGISVLERMAAEIDRRQELLRTVGRQHEGYDGFRANHPDPLPRMLLVLDGFGALLANHDRTAERAADLLERLARLGPHVGVHLILATSTSARAALVTRALAHLRSRLVLAATEEESELLLGTGNDEAATLGPVGDAIATSTLSDPSRNRRFQSVLVSGTELDICLGDLRRLADDLGLEDAPQVIDGSAIARLDQRPASALVGDRTHRSDRLLPRLWLGEPLALADPVEALIRRQDGSNLLVVADDPAVGQGVLLSAVTSACLVHGGAVTVLVLDFTPLEEGASEVVRLLSQRWPVQLTRRRSMTKVLDAVHCVIQDRLAHESFTGQPVLFVINGLGRAREFDVSPDSEAEHGPIDPTLLLETIVHDGPEVGVHTLLWCDNLTLLNRRTTPATIREFALRVAGPMSEDHSLALVDSEIAAGLGRNQAVFYDEDYGRLTRFRPFAVPDTAWLTGIVNGDRTSSAGEDLGEGDGPALVDGPVGGDAHRH